MKFRDFIPVLLDHGFEADGRSGTHRCYVGNVRGQTRIVIMDCARLEDEMSPRVFSASRRQSGLPRRRFRKGRRVTVFPGMIR